MQGWEGGFGGMRSECDRSVLYRNPKESIEILYWGKNKKEKQ